MPATKFLYKLFSLDIIWKYVLLMILVVLFTKWQASCRRNFSLDVVLSDAFGQLVNKEMEVIDFSIILLMAFFLHSKDHLLFMASSIRFMLHSCMLIMENQLRSQMIQKLLFWQAMMGLNLLLLIDQVNYQMDVLPSSSRYLRWYEYIDNYPSKNIIHFLSIVCWAYRKMVLKCNNLRLQVKIFCMLK